MTEHLPNVYTRETVNVCRGTLPRHICDSAALGRSC